MAAAGLIALTDGPARLHEDHRNARRLAEGVAEIVPGSEDPAAVPTNIVFADVSGTGRDAPTWPQRLAADGVPVTTVGGNVRMLTHVNSLPADIDPAPRAERPSA